MRIALWRCLRGINRSASSHLSITGLNGSSFDPEPARSGGLGEQSSSDAYFPAVCLDTPTSLAIRRQETPCAPGNPDMLLHGRRHRHVLSFPGKPLPIPGI